MTFHFIPAAVCVTCGAISLPSLHDLPLRTSHSAQASPRAACVRTLPRITALCVTTWPDLRLVDLFYVVDRDVTPRTLRSTRFPIWIFVAVLPRVCGLHTRSRFSHSGPAVLGTASLATRLPHLLPTFTHRTPRSGFWLR